MLALARSRCWASGRRRDGQRFTTREEVLGVYRKRARRYDLTADAYYLLGFREWAYRKRAIEALGLQRGDTVVAIGCGTGLNFALLEERIGPEGRLIGVDLTDAMLARARTRIEASEWRNVELVESPAASFRFPPEIDGILSTFALTLEPEFDSVIREGAKALKPRRRWVILDPQAAIQLAAPSGAGAHRLGETVRRLCGGGKAPPLGIPPAASEACDHAGAVFRGRLHRSRGGMIGSGGRPYGTTRLGAAGDLMTEATSRVKVLRRKPAAE